MKRKFLILICLILFFVSVAAVSATEDVNQTITEDTNNVVSSADTLSVSATEDVNQTMDEDALAVSEDVNVISAKDDGTFTALQKKINNAPGGSTINLENDYKYDDDFSKNGIYISKSLIINGNGHTIDALDQSRIFDIHSNVILNDMTFLNGNSANANIKDGGAIYVDGDLSVYNSHFINNHAGKYYSGGAIYAYFYGNLTVSHSTFDSNTAQWGGAICVHDKFNINDVSFNKNIANYGYGGAIYTTADSVIRNSNFKDNDGIGGAIYNWGDMLLFDSNFNSNYVYNLGTLFLNNNSMLQCAIQNYVQARDGQSILRPHPGSGGQAAALFQDR